MQFAQVSKKFSSKFNEYVLSKMINSLILLSIVLVLFVIYGELQKWRIQRKLNGFAIPKQLPVIGVAGRFINKTNEQMIDMLNEFISEVDKTPIQTWFGPMLGVLIAEPEDMQAVFSSEDSLNKPYIYDLMQCKTSLFVAEKDAWKPQRRAFDAIFNFKMLQNYVPLLNEKSKILSNRFQTHVDQPGDVYRSIFIGMIDMIFWTSAGVDQNIQTTEKGALLYNTVKVIMSNIMYRVTRIWLKWDFIYSLTQTYRDEQSVWATGNHFLETIIAEKVSELELLQRNGVDYLAEAHEKNSMNLLEKCLMMERNGIFTRVNTIDQLRVFIIAGIDTSSITVFATLLMLAIHEDHQNAVVAELKAIFTSADSDVSNDQLKRLVYLERCIREALRLFPPIPIIFRLTSGDIELKSGTIPTGTIVAIDFMHLHRNTKIWGQNAAEYEPERFLPENVAKRPPFSFIPFAAGARNCIGAKYAMISAKIALAHLLRRYKFTSQLKMNEIRFKMHIVLEIINEKPMSVERRIF